MTGLRAERQDAGRGGRDHEAVAGPAWSGTRESGSARAAKGRSRAGRTREKSGARAAEGRTEGLGAGPSGAGAARSRVAGAD